MSPTDLVSELIDTRSFASLWYWIFVTAVWVRETTTILGAPVDLIRRALRDGGAAEDDLESILSVHIRRLIGVTERHALVLTTIAAALLAALMIFAVVYGVEIAQAVALVLVPISALRLVALRHAHIVASGQLDAQAVCRRLLAHRTLVQVIGAVSLFVTALFGTYSILATDPLG